MKKRTARRFLMFVLTTVLAVSFSVSLPGNAYARDYPYAKPVDNWPDTGGYIGFGAGNPGWAGLHLGIDIYQNTYSPVYAVLDGTVIMGGNNIGGYGNDAGSGGAVVIEHKSGSGQLFYALYGHVNVSVSAGDRVSKGQKIGEVMDLRYGGSPLPHLHFGINTRAASYAGYGDVNGDGFVDPVRYLDENITAAAPELTDVTASFGGKTIAILSVEAISRGLGIEYVSAVDTGRGYRPLRVWTNAMDISGTSWEKYHVTVTPDNYAVLVSAADGTCVKANLDKERAPLEAVTDRGRIGAWECFSIYRSGDNYYLQAQANGKWVTAWMDDESYTLLAQGDSPDAWERFIIQDVTAVSGTADTLYRGHELKIGQAIVSENGLYKAVMQDDSNFVVYGPEGALWATGTDGKGGQRFILQLDGNLVLYTPDERAIWSPNIFTAERLIMQNDGNLVAYSKDNGAVWASNTAR